MKKWCVCVAVSLIALCSIVVLASGGDPPFPSPGRDHQNPSLLRGPIGPPGFGFGPFFDPRFEQQLNLSKEQLDKIKKLRDISYKETRDLRYKLAQKHLEMRRLFGDPKVGEETLLTQQKELSTLSMELQNNIAYMMIKVRKILSPEQISRLDQIAPPPPPPPPPVPYRMSENDRFLMEEERCH